MATPYAMVSLEKTISTQDEARRLFGSDPMLVVAREQTGGRGRSGSPWQNASHSLAASLAVRLDWPVDTWSRLTLIAGVAAIHVLDGDLTLKWPNDVMRGEDKLAGILTEVSGGVAVVGLGVNLYWPQAPSGMGAVLVAAPSPRYGVDLARRWAERVLETIGRGPDRWPIDEYRASCRTIGREITWDPTGEGVAEGVDDEGRLVVRTDDGLITLAAGEVRELRAVD